MSISSFWQLYDSIIPLILKNTFAVNDTLSGVIMAADNVLALFLLPLFGMLSDNTSTILGKRTPYILGGTIAAVVFVLVIPLADKYKVFWLFMAALACVLLAMSTYRSPAVALMPDLTPKPLRSKANAVINLMGALGGIISLALISVLVPKGKAPDYLPVFACVAIIMLAAVGLLLATVKEKRFAANMPKDEEEPEKTDNKGVRLPPDVMKSLALTLASIFLWFTGYNAVTTAFSKYANTYWGLEGGAFAYTLIIAQIAAIIAFLPVGIIASRIGRRKTILGGIVLLTFAFTSAMFFRTFHTSIFFFFALAGVGWASINVNSYPMVVEMSKGADVGKYTGIYYMFSMSAQVLTPIISGALLQYVGYWTLFPYGAFFVALSFITMYFVRHGDNRPARPGVLEALGGPED